MDYSKLPINEKRTIRTEKHLAAVAKRVNEDEVIVSYVDLKSSAEILRIIYSIKSDTQILQFVEPKYWKIYSGGRYLSNFNFSGVENFEIIVNVETIDNSLEIKSISNIESKNGSKSV